MQVRNNTTSTTFCAKLPKAKVRINYRQLEGLGEKAIQAAENSKQILEQRDPGWVFDITRGYKLNLSEAYHSPSESVIIPTNNIQVNAKKRNTTILESIQNIFRLNPAQPGSTPLHSEKGIISAANKAERRANEAKHQNVFSLLKYLSL